MELWYFRQFYLKYHGFTFEVTWVPILTNVCFFTALWNSRCIICNAFIRPIITCKYIKIDMRFLEYIVALVQVWLYKDPTCLLFCYSIKDTSMQERLRIGLRQGLWWQGDYRDFIVTSYPLFQVWRQRFLSHDIWLQKFILQGFVTVVYCGKVTGQKYITVLISMKMKSMMKLA